MVSQRNRPFRINLNERSKQVISSPKRKYVQREIFEFLYARWYTLASFGERKRSAGKKMARPISSGRVFCRVGDRQASGLLLSFFFSFFSFILSFFFLWSRLDIITHDLCLGPMVARSWTWSSSLAIAATDSSWT